MAVVLVADDDADHRELMSLSLHRFGHEAVPVTDTRTAAALLARGGIDALLLDIRMPGEPGIEFCRRLRTMPEGASLPIMFVTADVNEDRIQAAMNAGADDYLTKPFHRSELAARLDNLLLRRSVLPGRTVLPGRSASAATAALLAARRAFQPPAAAAGPEQRIA